MTEEQEKLVVDNEKLIYHILKTLNITDIDDYWDIGAIGLCRAAITYDPEKNDKFSHYACKCIKFELLRQIRLNDRAKRKSNKNMVYINTSISDDDVETIQDLIESDVNVENEVINNIMVEEIANGLNQNQSYAFIKLIDGYKLQDIGNDLNLSCERVRQFKKPIQKIAKEWVYE